MGRCHSPREILGSPAGEHSGTACANPGGSSPGARRPGELRPGAGSRTSCPRGTLRAASPCSSSRPWSSWRCREGSGSVRPAHAPAALGGPLVFVQTAPGAVLLRPADRVGEALRPDRAGRADRLGLALAELALRLALPVGAKEEHNLTATARSLVLPAPVRSRHQGSLAAYLRHE